MCCRYKDGFIVIWMILPISHGVKLRAYDNAKLILFAFDTKNFVSLKKMFSRLELHSRLSQLAAYN